MTSWAADPEDKRLHDPAYGASYLCRGNLRTSWTRSSQTTKTMTHDIGGNVIQTTGGLLRLRPPSAAGAVAYLLSAGGLTGIPSPPVSPGWNTPLP